jgi:hypothetical protein
MRKAKIIISLQVLFLTGILVFSAGIDYNNAQHSLLPSAVSHLAIRQDGYELANPESYASLQSKLAVKSAIRDAARSLQQDPVPAVAGAQALEMPGAKQLYLVPIALDDQKKETILIAMSRYDQPAEVTAVIEKNDTLSREMGVFVGLPPAKSIESAIAASKTSSAGVDIALGSLTVKYLYDKEVMDSILALNANLARQIGSLQSAFTIRELRDTIGMFQTTALKGTGTDSYIMGVLDATDNGYVLAFARILDEAGRPRALSNSMLLIHLEKDFGPVEVYPVVSVRSNEKSFSAGKLMAFTDYLRLYGNDGPAWARAILQRNIQQTVQEAGISAAEPVSGYGKAFENITQNLPAWFDAGVIAESKPIEIPGLDRAFILAVTENGKTAHMLLVETFTGIEYGQISDVELNSYAKAALDSSAEMWPNDEAQQDIAEKARVAERFMHYIMGKADLAKTSSAGLTDLLKFSRTNIPGIDTYADRVLDFAKRLEEIANENKPIEELLTASRSLDQDIASLEREISALTVDRQQQDELDAIKRTAQDLKDAVRTTADISYQIGQVLTISSIISARGADIQDIQNIPDVLVEADKGMKQQFDAAKKVSVLSEKHGKVVNELDIINEKVGCNMASVDINALDITDAGNTVAIVTTEAGRQAFKARGVENILMLQNVVEDGKYDLLSMAALAKGRYLKTRGIEDNKINMLIRSAYRNLTGREIPLDYLQNVAMIVDVILLPVSPVYKDGELEAYHMMRLLALIAA